MVAWTVAVSVIFLGLAKAYPQGRTENSLPGYIERGIERTEDMSKEGDTSQVEDMDEVKDINKIDDMNTMEYMSKGGETGKIDRGYLLFRGEYQIYFIRCVENIRIFMSAQHE